MDRTHKIVAKHENLLVLFRHDFKEITNLRNDINHGGFTNDLDPEDLMQSLLAVYANVKKSITTNSSNS